MTLTVLGRTARIGGCKEKGECKVSFDQLLKQPDLGATEDGPVIDAYSKICSTAIVKRLGERWLKTTAVAFWTMLLTASSVFPPVRRLLPPCSGRASKSMRMLRDASRE